MKNLALILILAITACNNEPKNPEIFQKDGAAIGGYDAVAFFKTQKPVKGADSLETQWRNAQWKFSSKENLDSFLEAPEKYAPQYGGYCAYGTAGGYKAPTEADAWTIVNNKLYFNYNNEVKETWSKDIPGLVSKADENWKKIRYN